MNPYPIQENNAQKQNLDLLEQQLRKTTLRLSRVLRQCEAQKRKPRPPKEQR